MLEAIAFQTGDVVGAMEKDLQEPHLISIITIYGQYS